MIPRERILTGFRETFASFGFVPIETPHIERMEVLTGKGAGSEEVLRQIFDVTNKGGTPGELALRFDLTVPLARFVAKHIDELGVPFKRYAIGSVFRGERPAKGRFREFVQCDFDTIGTESLLADAEIAQVVHAALLSAGVTDFTITLNDRRVLNGLLESQGIGGQSGSVLRALDKLDKIGPDGVRQELAKPADAGGAGLPADKAGQILELAVRFRGGAELLDEAKSAFGSSPVVEQGIANLCKVFELLGEAGVPQDRLRVNLGLARGLDYYTGIVYETTVNGWEKFGSVASGGRYDNLASLFTPRRLPGVGASIGLDRLMALLDEARRIKSSATRVAVLVANFPGTNPAVPVKLAARLRAAGIGAEVFPDPIPIGRQMGYGSSRGHKIAVIVGPDEEARQVFNLRNLSSRMEDKGLAWSVLEDSVESALEILKQEGAGS
jgi:histidyl-tRNA synthetase